MKRLDELLDDYVADFDYAERLRKDPLEIPHRYPRREDAEVAAFIAAMFAYGRVRLFKPVVERILAGMGEGPSAFLREYRRSRDQRFFEDISYRLSRPDEVTAFLGALSSLLKRHGSIEAAFLAADDASQRDIGTGLIGLMDELRCLGTPRDGAGTISRGLLHLLPSPVAGGAAKRACLFLRWVVRSGDVDLGIWSGVSPARLVIPLDTHIRRIAQCLGLTTRKSPGWAMAREVSENLRTIDPADPLKYDFPLCHLGMRGDCPPRPTGDACEPCLFGPLKVF